MTGDPPFRRQSELTFAQAQEFTNAVIPGGGTSSNIFYAAKHVIAVRDYCKRGLFAGPVYWGPRTEWPDLTDQEIEDWLIEHLGRPLPQAANDEERIEKTLGIARRVIIMTSSPEDAALARLLKPPV